MIHSPMTGPIREELERQLEELREKLYETCTPLVKVAQTSFRRHYWGPESAWLVYAFNAYDYLANGIDYFINEGLFGVMAEYFADIVGMDIKEVDERVKAVDDHTLKIKVESLGRVVETCNEKQSLLDFARLRRSIERAERKARREDDEEVLELLERLKVMNVGEFMKEWKDIVERLDEHDYDDLLWNIYRSLEYDNVFGDALGREIEYLARELLGATEEQAEKIVSCLIEC